MDNQAISEVSRAAVEGAISFPEIVRRLLDAGVESYHVDYIRMRKTFYGADTESVVTAIPYHGLGSVASDFSAEWLKEAIMDSQRNGQSYRVFTERAMAAGVFAYMAFLRGKRVTYWGRTGDIYTEWFPGAAPAPRQRVSAELVARALNEALSAQDNYQLSA